MLDINIYKNIASYVVKAINVLLSDPLYNVENIDKNINIINLIAKELKRSSFTRDEFYNKIIPSIKEYIKEDNNYIQYIAERIRPDSQEFNTIIDRLMIKAYQALSTKLVADKEILSTKTEINPLKDVPTRPVGFWGAFSTEEKVLFWGGISAVIIIIVVIVIRRKNKRRK